MDVQRSNKRGKANYFVVIPIRQENTKNNLREVQTHLENKYPSARAELRKAFTDLETNEAHITLFAIHANKERIEQVKRAINKFLSKLKEEQLDLSFELELKGLGSWHTKGGNIIVYADLAKECRPYVKLLAKQIRDLVVEAVEVEEGHPSKCKSIQESSEDEDSEKEEESEEEIEQEKQQEKGALNFDIEDQAEIDEEGSGFVEDFSGLWFDDPLPEIYIPHLTLLNSDPSWDKKLRDRLLERSNVPSKKDRDKKKNQKGKRGGKGDRGRRGEKWRDNNGEDSWNREREDDEVGEEEGGEEEDKWKVKEGESFGHDYGLLRDVRNDYSKISFGKEKVNFVELQSGFQVLAKIPISHTIVD